MREETKVCYICEETKNLKSAYNNRDSCCINCFALDFWSHSPQMQIDEKLPKYSIKDEATYAECFNKLLEAEHEKRWPRNTEDLV